MIVTVTLNPSIDRTAPIAGPLRRGQVNRLGSSTEVAAGKGSTSHESFVGLESKPAPWCQPEPRAA